ncbi:hypothetical protein GCM10011533_00820 [Streptosporangium jomthongense]|nr:hypothetical protein GCM10011533_00820 [Streptosporangium jomthongense]
MVFRGDTQVTGKRRFQTGLIQATLNLRARPEGNNQSHTETAQQRDVMNDVDKIFMYNRIAREGKYDRATTMGIYIRR